MTLDYNIELIRAGANSLLSSVEELMTRGSLSRIEAQALLMISLRLNVLTSCLIERAEECLSGGGPFERDLYPILSETRQDLGAYLSLEDWASFLYIDDPEGRVKWNPSSSDCEYGQYE